ncbi:hypothetical protein PthstB1num2_19000 [Parageobacillus thermoglucosidasius]|nr:hypothetical protein PthstB1num2_19000 [Parageobacillus thermoglucosidasius]
MSVEIKGLVFNYLQLSLSVFRFKFSFNFENKKISYLHAAMRIVKHFG